MKRQASSLVTTRTPMMARRQCARLVCVLCVSLLLCAIPTSCWAGPVIEFFGVVVGRSVGPDGGEWYGDSAEITVFDADGWEGLSVSTMDPNGRLRPGAGDSCDYWNEGDYLLHQVWAQYGQTEPLLTGSYEATAEDAHGNLSEPVTATFEEYPLFPDISSPENGSAILDTVPTFAWEPVPGACRYDIYLEELGPDAHGVWGVSELPPTTTSVSYNEDGSASDPTLVPGATYLLHVTAYYPDQDPSDRVWIASGSERIIEFSVYSPVPVITWLEVRRGSAVSPEGTVSYQQRVKVFASDSDGAADVGTVTVTDSRGDSHEAWWVCDRDQATAAFCWDSWGEADPSPSGTYAATVTDLEGNAATAAAQVSPLPDDPGLVPVIETPAANYSIATAAPEFSWSVPSGVGCYCLTLREVDGACQVWCPWLVSSPITYGGEDLLPGHLYDWSLWSLDVDAIAQSDPAILSGFLWAVTGRFWVEPKFVGFLDPVNDDGSSIFRLGATVPVKFQLIAADGSQVADATCELHLAKVTDNVTGTELEVVSTNAADSGSTFRYAADHYQLNLSTKALSQGTYRLWVTINREVVHETTISLK
jgi:hypothetical protein